MEGGLWVVLVETDKGGGGGLRVSRGGFRVSRDGVDKVLGSEHFLLS